MLLDRALITELLHDLAHRLALTGQPAAIRLVGGAAIAVGRFDIEPANPSRVMVTVVPSKWTWPLEPLEPLEPVMSGGFTPPQTLPFAGGP
jgi:hypothetical protein